MTVQHPNSRANLSTVGRRRTSRPRIYVGCLPCAKHRYVADIEHANRWLEHHWRSCPRTETLGLCQPAESRSGRAA